MQSTYLKLLLATGIAMWSDIFTIARDFSFQGVSYTIIDEDEKTCQTTPMVSGACVNANVRGDLALPSHPLDGTTEYTLVAIGEGSFYNNSVLTSVVIPATVTQIGIQAFYRNTKLKSVDISDSVVAIADQAFGWNDALTTLKLGTSVESVGYQSFYRCGSLSTVIFPASLRTIGEYAFANCSALTRLDIPEGVETIGNAAFRYCTSLESVTVPTTAESLGQTIFGDCNSIMAVTYKASNPVFGNANCFDDNAYANAILSIDPQALELIKSKTPWSLFRHLDPDTPVSAAISTYAGMNPDLPPIETYDCDGHRICGSLTDLPPGIYIIRQGAAISKVAIR